jgi:hypothetical protein
VRFRSTGRGRSQALESKVRVVDRPTGTRENATTRGFIEARSLISLIVFPTPECSFRGMQLPYQLEDQLSLAAWTAYSLNRLSPHKRSPNGTKRRFVVFDPGVLVCGTLAAAQVAPQSAPPAQSQSAARITLGQSAVPLFGPWKFTVGDSPIDPKTGKPLWAEPDFDDSRWETVDLTPKNGAIDPGGGNSGYVPGWTAKGHPGYWGYAWYRIRVQVQARPGQELALAGPADVDDAYQVFENGELTGHFGDFDGRKPKIYYTQPRMFPLAQAGSQSRRRDGP